MYAAAVLTEKSIHELKKVVTEQLDVKKLGYQFSGTGYNFPHHMTINMGELDAKLNKPEILNKNVTLSYDTVVYDLELGVCAVPIIKKTTVSEPGHITREINTINQHPHITCCTKLGSKPKFSNQMLNMPGPDTRIVKLNKTNYLDAIVQMCD